MVASRRKWLRVRCSYVEKAEARAPKVLDHLLTGNYSDAQLQEIYRRGDADISFPHGLRYFWGLARATIDRGA